MAEMLKARACNPDVPGSDCQLDLFYGSAVFKFLVYNVLFCGLLCLQSLLQFLRLVQ